MFRRFFSTMMFVLLLLGVALAGVTDAMARGDRPPPGNEPHGRNSHGERPPPGRAISAPEFDPAAAGVVAALVAGGAILITRRRRARNS